MATLYLSEFANMAGVGSRFVNAAPMAPLAEQTLSIGGSSTRSNAFSSTTQIIRVAADQACSISIGASPTATATKARLPANVPEYFAVQPGHMLAVITNSCRRAVHDAARISSRVTTWRTHLMTAHLKRR